MYSLMNYFLLWNRKGYYYYYLKNSLATIRFSMKFQYNKK